MLMNIFQGLFLSFPQMKRLNKLFRIFILNVAIRFDVILHMISAIFNFLLANFFYCHLCHPVSKFYKFSDGHTGGKIKRPASRWEGDAPGAGTGL